MILSTRSLIISGAFVVFLAGWYLLVPSPELPEFQVRSVSADITSPQTPSYQASWVTSGHTDETHSANIVIHQGIPLVVWYGGTEEGASDVALYIAYQLNGEWSEPLRVIDRETAQNDLDRYIRKVGNPVLHSWADGRLGLFFVTVSVGGWAASSVNYTEMINTGIFSTERLNTERLSTERLSTERLNIQLNKAPWTPAKRLVTSPFLNISTLVRNRSVDMTDGTILLPVYHEFMGKFSEILRMDSKLRISGKTRLSNGRDSLQPSVAALTPVSAVALARYAGREKPRVLHSTTTDGGQHWTGQERLSLPNPNSAVAVVNIGEGRLLAALNDTESGRHRLSLAISEDTKDQFRTWTLVKTLEAEQTTPGSHEFEFSYPSFAVDPKAQIHLVYTWNQTRIRHVVFNHAWLLGDARLNPTEVDEKRPDENATAGLDN